MNTTRLLTTFAVAAALTGGIGFAYAQTTTDRTQTPASTSSGSTPMATPASGTSPNATVDTSGTMPAATTTAPPMNTDSVGGTGERTPKADRG